MAPIVRAKAPVSIARRRLVGAVAMPLSIAVMVPWLAAYALYAGTVLTVRSVAKAPRALLGIVDYAGTAVLGH
ncbi:MAG: hypothetical protein M3R41_00570 [Pseudomonadota bacterium]|nr:hypothetical protein [Pseudomonadota bacterium]